MSFCQQKDTALSKLLDADISELYKQRLDSLSKEVERLDGELQRANWKTMQLYDKLRRANDNTSTVVRLFSVFRKIENKEITKQDSSFYADHYWLSEIDTTGPMIIEYYDGVQDYLPSWDSLLKSFPYVEKLYKSNKLQFKLVPNEVMYTNAPEIRLPPMPAFSGPTSLQNKQKLAAEWDTYVSQVVALCGCPQVEFDRINNMIVNKKEKAKSDFLKKNRRDMNKTELLDMQIELAQKCAFFLEKKYCKK